MGSAPQKIDTDLKDYSGFEQIDGSHEFKKLLPDCVVEYGARLREGAQVVYFNFALAKEMGLLDEEHPNKLNKELEKKLIQTFGIVIINEYDIENNIQFDPKTVLDRKYMATRYLQLQHPDNVGKNSGDGRSIWNGRFKGKGKIWDISSCGAGATCLSPATSIHGRYFQTGDPSISYGCGYSEIDEGLSTLVFSEVFAKNHISTERALAIIKFADGYSLTVRAHYNLLRPSHFFAHIKQGNREILKQMIDYYMNREVKNKKIKKTWSDDKSMHKAFLEYFTENFTRTAAMFEDDYIFCWLDWDGDNILMDGGIIDYGSIRQFGLFHHEYRYDDIDRFSTTISEQKNKVKYMIQTFAQIIHFVETGKKLSISKFAKHWTIKKFDKRFEEIKDYNLLSKIGFDKVAIDKITSSKPKLIRKFRKNYSYFERAKSKAGRIEVTDGVNWNAIFCMRDILRELPQLLMARDGEFLEASDFIDVLASSYALKEDLKISKYRSVKVKEFQQQYLKLVKFIAQDSKNDINEVLLNISMRSSIINRYDRVTGDSISYIVDLLMKKLDEMNVESLYNIVEEFSDYQKNNPREVLDDSTKNKKPTFKIVNQFFDIVKECREGI